MAKQNNIEEYLKLMQKIREGKEEPTAEELQFFLEFAPTIDEAKLAELTKKASEKQLALGSEELSQYTQLLAQKAATSEATREDYLKRAQDISKQKATGKITDIFNVALAAGDVISSTQQINEARKLQRASRRPERPAPLTKDPQLQQAIFEAQQGNFDTARRLAPAQQEILNQYLSDLNVAKTASTGQAGTYGALAQVASTRRGRGAQELVPMADQIRRQDQSRLDNLLQMRLNENENIQRSQAMYYPTELQNYQQEQQAIGELGSVGRENLRSSLMNAGAQVAGGLGDAAAKMRYNRIRAKVANYSPEVQDLVVNTAVRNDASWAGLDPDQYVNYNQYIPFNDENFQYRTTRY